MSEYKWIENVAGSAGDIQPDSILSRTLVRSEHVKAVLFAFDQGQSLSEHQASQAAILQIVSGEATVTVGADTYAAKPGAMLYMPPGLRHSIVAETPLKMLLLLLQNKQDAK